MVAGSISTQGQQAAVTRSDGMVTLIGFLPDGNFKPCQWYQPEMVVGYSSTGWLGLQTTPLSGPPPGDCRISAPWAIRKLFSAATAVNGVGTIGGYATRPVAGGDDEAPAGALDHGAICGSWHLGGAEGFANGMNEQGDIVAESQTPNGSFMRSLWPVEGTP